MSTTPALISATALADHIKNQADCVILDCSWHLPSSKRDAAAEFLASHIEGARFFDLNAISDTASPLPHMLPKPADFAAWASANGIGNQTLVIATDSNRGAMAACRVWWMFRVFGHDRVTVLDGGLASWQTAGFGLESGPAKSIAPAHFSPNFRPELVKTADDIALGGAVVIDARSAARFQGDAAEPRPGLASGHIPGARNLPFDRLFNETGHFLDESATASCLAEAGIDPEEPLIASCGSGVTACVLAHALFRLGVENVPVYDGSWAEWGAGGRPVATGPA